MRVIFLYIMMCVSEIQGHDFVTIYSYVCLRYRLKELLLYTLICV